MHMTHCLIFPKNVLNYEYGLVVGQTTDAPLDWISSLSREPDTKFFGFPH